MNGGKHAPLLEARGISRQAANGTWLLHDISLTVHAGQRLALVGKSGSGKTLLLRALAKLDACQGQVWWRGAEVSSLDVPRFRSQVIYLHQRPILSEGTVQDNLREPLAWRVHGRRDFNRRQVLQWLDQLERDERFLSQQHSDLSGGEAAMVALLRAIQLEPSVLLLDEPTAAIDADTTRLVEAFVRHWHQADPDRALVWVSHDARQARRVAQQLVVMDQGRIISSSDFSP